MTIVHSQKPRSAQRSTKLAGLVETISETQLREWVERISVPRHYVAEAEQNRITADWLVHTFESLGYQVERQGQYSNIVARPEAMLDEVILIGAHYDSVPMSPGADDNGSAVAAMLGCAAACCHWRPVAPLMFVAFNREEDGLLGSRDFVTSYLREAHFRVRCAHVLEMVGFASSARGSQRIPSGLPVKVDDKGDFLGLLANRHSKEVMDFALRQAGAYVPALPVTGLNVKLGLEKFFPVLARSDHASFWEGHIPSVMWTDTSEFRNHHYHCHTDTPETLDYRFLRHVTQLLTACVIAQSGQVSGNEH